MNICFKALKVLKQTIFPLLPGTRQGAKSSDFLFDLLSRIAWENYLEEWG
jgi:hypothetical protein